MIESTHEELIYLRVLLIDVLMEHLQLNELHHVLMHTEVTANKIAQIIGYCYRSFIEGRTIEEIGILLSEIESVKIDVTVHKVKQTSTYLVSSLSTNNPKLNEEIESFQKAMDQVKKQLLGGLHQLDVISLVGMPKIGKTTLAEKIYNDPISTSHFDVNSE
ncbi:hypothetical protein KY290_007537 [Solanum tuberosum]|uniref:NB-ARC domain-containing protein n=1 Tax=Solanum tuberosum TaxID=4113 RepID=A0ABQ7W5V2_SOLTU|nr:hypothetical protein KY290_007537 [Solanum tuberosum]